MRRKVLILYCCVGCMFLKNMPRPMNEAFTLLQFTLLKGPNHKYNAFCEVCKKTLCNTATARLRAHRNRCRPEKDTSTSALNLISTQPTSSKMCNDVSADSSQTRESSTNHLEMNMKNSPPYQSDSRYEDLDVNMQIVDVEGVTREECVAFGQYVSTQLMKMDARTCAVIKYKICETLYNAEISILSKEQIL